MIFFTLENEGVTERLAHDLASLLMPGDCVTFSGGLGAGKSFFVRALLRYLARDGELEVPSPTFTLVQSYPLERFTAHHADFYRLSHPDEVVELGLFEDDGSVSLIEWPENATDALPQHRLEVTLEVTGPSSRRIGFSPLGPSWGERMERLVDRGAFLAKAGQADALRVPMQGDCSTRIYTRLLLAAGCTAILMDAPKKADSGIGALSYSRVAHLAEDILPFVAVDEALVTKGFSAPRILAADLAKGFLLLEDFGGEGLLDERRRPILARYEAGVDCLVALHRVDWPQDLPVAGNINGSAIHSLPPFDEEAILAEVQLFADWYMPHMGMALSEEARAAFLNVWRMQAQDLQVLPRTLVLRDFHSPNIMWLGERTVHQRVGLIDFQDALYGPAAYDLVSATQDARVFMPESVERSLLNRYLEARADEAEFDPLAFLKSYRVLGAQRATKVLGIFARLARRDGKAQHLDKLPIVRDYLARNLAHDGLAELAAWHEAHAPVLEPV